MTERKTLTINKPATQNKPTKQKPSAPNPFKALIGQVVQIQTKGPTILSGRITLYVNGFITLEDVTEFRRQPNDALELEGEHRKLMLDRSAVQFLSL